jgi:hypothetical protein
MVHFVNLTEGRHTLLLAVTDAEGKEGANESFSWVVDVTPPNVTIIIQRPAIVSPYTSPTFMFGCKDANPPCSYLFALNSGDWSVAENNPSIVLSEGSHVLAVKALDAAGNMDPTGANFSWSIDLTPANTTIENQPEALSASSEAQFSFGCSDGPGQCAFRYMLDSSGWQNFGVAAWTGRVPKTVIAIMPALSAQGVATMTPQQGLVSSSRGFTFQLSAAIQVAVPFQYRVLGEVGLADWVTLPVGKNFVDFVASKDGNFSFQVYIFFILVTLPPHFL